MNSSFGRGRRGVGDGAIRGVRSVVGSPNVNLMDSIVVRRYLDRRMLVYLCIIWNDREDKEGREHLPPVFHSVTMFINRAINFLFPIDRNFLSRTNSS